MSVLNTLPAPVIQMGLVEKIVEVEQNQPHVQQLVAQETARQELREQGERVSLLQTTDPGRRVREREGGGQGRPGAHGERRAAEQAEDAADEGQTDEGAYKANPWAGHIVDVKI